MKKLTLSLIAAVAMTSALTTSCNSSEPQGQDLWMTVDFTLDSDEYNSKGYWVNVYSENDKNFGIYPLGFTHEAQVDVYDGVKYESFTGFCPSIVNDTTDHTGSDWTQYQFASIATPGMYGYLIAHWDVRETPETPLDQRSCLIDCFTTVRPVALSVTNTTYSYYVMKNGSPFSRPFGPDDYLALDIYGVKDGVAKLSQSVYLAKDGVPINKWGLVDLTPLGEVQSIFFTMRSSDTGEWGMNTPAYFAINAIQLVYPNVQNLN